MYPRNDVKHNDRHCEEWPGIFVGIPWQSHGTFRLQKKLVGKQPGQQPYYEIAAEHAE